MTRQYAKERGARFEVEVVEYLLSRGHSAHRKAKAGSKDTGDVGGLPGWTLEAKHTRALALGPALNEAKREAAVAGTPWYAAIFKRRRTVGSTGSVADSYVVMPLSIFAEIARR